MHNFIGKDNFVWWIGRVENRVDPLGLGRCQVRIYGYHGDGSDESIANIPSDALPWAQPLYSINTSKTFSAPMINDWVMGFFLDGLSAQAPVMLGVLPGYVSDLPNSVPGRMTTPTTANTSPFVPTVTIPTLAGG